MSREQILKVAKALSDNIRVEIFEMLQTGKKCACEILEKLNITQPTLSHHMKILCDSGIILYEKDWKWTYYWINCEVLKDYITYISNVACINNITQDNNKKCSCNC